MASSRHAKYPLFLYDFNENVSQQFFEKFVTNFTKISPVGAECGRTDMTKLIVAFRNSARTRLKLVTE